MVVCKCVFPDRKEVDITVDRDANGSDLFNSVCKYLDIHDKTPFGLVHRGGSKPSPYNWWVRLDKPLKKQITGKCQVWAFALVVKFYPQGNISKYEDIARFFFVRQVRDDLLTGRLSCPDTTMALLASYWLQSDYGTYASDAVDRQLVDAFRYVRRGGRSKKGAKSSEESDIDFEEQMIELHRCLKDMPASKADIKFLKLASSLSMYGTHFFPGFELPGSAKSKSRVRECGDPVRFGMGVEGILVHKTMMKDMKSYPWKSTEAIAFKYNSVTLKLHPTSDKKQPVHISYAFDDLNQAKIVWRAAIDMHVHYRVEKRDLSSQVVSVKLKRKWSLLGKKQAKTAIAPPTPVIRRPQLSAIAENSPTSLRKSRSSLHHEDETTPKEIEARESEPKTTQFPALPLKTPRSPSMRSHVSHKTNSPAAQRRASLTSSPVTTRKEKERSRSPSPKPTSKPSTEATTSLTARFNEKVASSVPVRLRSGYTTSQTSTAGEEVLSDVTDNTDVLCSNNIIEKAFSYAEEDGINNIRSWLELCTPRDNDRGRPLSRSAPASQRSRSRGRSPVHEVEADDINDYKPLIRSKRPVVIRARELRDLSPPLTVHYEDEPTRRRPGRYRSADNVARKDWTIRREPRPAFDAAARRFADIYRREYLDNVADYEMYRRARSMYSLVPRNAIRDRSTSSDYRVSGTPSTVSAHASSGSRRSCDSYLGAQYDDDFYRRTYNLPVESAFTRRVLSESRLARANQHADDMRATAEITRKREDSSRQRRRHITSWAFGDRDDL